MNLNIFQRRKTHKYSALQLTVEPSWSERNYASFAKEGYIKNVIAFRAINMIANAAFSVPYILLIRQIKVHPLLKLLYSPKLHDAQRKEGSIWSATTAGW